MGQRKPRKLALSLPLAIGTTLIAGRLLGPMALLISSAVAFLALAWWHDNDLGSCLSLAVLVVIAFAVLLMLIALTGIVFQR